MTAVMRRFFRRKFYQWKYLLIIFLSAFLCWYIFSLPEELFSDPFSTVLMDKSGSLLGARIAADGQWRFPEIDSVPDRFQKAILLFEDQYFFSHPGVNPFSIVRALWQNINHGEIFSGGSTVTMQTIRLSRKNKARTIWEKLVESLLATRLEFRFSKKKILTLYASHAPFGGNVVGLDAACWRYFGREMDKLTWAEAALLAVLPNNPGLIHPGKNREQLMAKRNRLLTRLLDQGQIDSLTWALAQEEPLPDKPQSLPDLTPHLLNRMVKEGYNEQKIKSTVELNLQEVVNQIVQLHQNKLKSNEIWNAAALVIETSSGEVIAYTGNVSDPYSAHQNNVDIIDAPRSTGSILKPFLFAAMLDEGLMLANTLLPDVPTLIDGFAPQNFSKKYDGAVPANDALIRSLNVPAVYMLKDFRYERFHRLLQQMGMQTLVNTPDHYGLSLILGGAEAKLWDLAGIYASMGRVLMRYNQTQGKARYSEFDFHSPVWKKNSQEVESDNQVESGLLSASAIWQTLETLTELNRPDEESGWRNFQSAQRIAWKTGTSYGLRDAWSIGVTPDYVVAVWVGNATGEGRPGLIGGEVAAPIMLDIFRQLPHSQSWFDTPLDDMIETKICVKSGYLAGIFCEQIENRLISSAGAHSSVCPHHVMLHISPDQRYQVNAGCQGIDQIINKKWFILPPTQAHYYQKKNINYQSPPPYRTDCNQSESISTMAIIYPREKSKIYIPRLLDGKQGEITFELAHSQKNSQVFWHLNSEYLGTTTEMHHMSFSADKGKHRLQLIDNSGLNLEHEFEVISD